MNNCFFISEGAFTFKVEGRGVITRGFFVSGGCEVYIYMAQLALIGQRIMWSDDTRQIEISFTRNATYAHQFAMGHEEVSLEIK